MINPPKPDRSGNLELVEKKGKGAGNQIESYPIAQTISNLNESILNKYNSERDRAKAAGKSSATAENAAQVLVKTS